jgi:putative drug exporter of the RND superfamily
MTSSSSGHGWTHRLFAGIGSLSVRFRWFVLVGWIVVTILAVKTLPSLSSVANNDNSAFLPVNSPSIKAASLAAPFQRGFQPTAQLVAASAHGPLTGADQTAISRIETRIAHLSTVAVVRDQGIASDGMARKALVTFSNNSAGGDGTALVDSVRNTFRSGLPAGLQVHLTGELPIAVDAQSTSNSTLRNSQIYSVIFILLLLLVVFRSALAPLITLIPVGLALALSGPVIAESSKWGVQVSSITEIMLSVLLLGAGTDYGLFLVFRVREELRRGREPRDAVVYALSWVGESITFSAATVVAALLCLLFASFGFYHGLGPALAIGLVITLLIALTLLPALLSILGRVLFWPSMVNAGTFRNGLWGTIASRIVARPVLTLIVGVLLFGGLAVFATGYTPGGFTDNGSTSTTSDSARGTAAITAHFPAAQSNPTNVLMAFEQPVWSHPQVLVTVRAGLATSHVFSAVSGPLNPNGLPIAPTRLVQLHQKLGPAITLPPTQPSGTGISAAEYNAYRATAQFISPDGRTVQYYTALAAGVPGGNAAMHAIPRIRDAVHAVATRAGAAQDGVAGESAAAYDISSISTSDLEHIVPIVLICIAILLALVLRSLIAPLYLIVSVAFSYLASLGLAVVVFLKFGGGSGLTFILPFMLFIFVMSLGEDYNILMMSRIREEAHSSDLPSAITRALGATGGTITSAGLILAGTFGVLGVLTTGQIQELGFTIAAGILMDTFLVRTLLLPSTVAILGKWNWWPSSLHEFHASLEEVEPVRAAGD